MIHYIVYASSRSAALHTCEPGITFSSCQPVLRLRLALQVREQLEIVAFALPSSRKDVFNIDVKARLGRVVAPANESKANNAQEHHNQGNDEDNEQAR